TAAEADGSFVAGRHLPRSPSGAERRHLLSSKRHTHGLESLAPAYLLGAGSSTSGRGGGRRDPASPFQLAEMRGIHRSRPGTAWGKDTHRLAAQPLDFYGETTGQLRRPCYEARAPEIASPGGFAPYGARFRDEARSPCQINRKLPGRECLPGAELCEFPSPWPRRRGCPVR